MSEKKEIKALNGYIEEKFKTLYELGIKPNPDDRNRIKTCRSEIALDQFARSLIKREWGML